MNRRLLIFLSLAALVAIASYSASYAPGQKASRKSASAKSKTVEPTPADPKARAEETDEPCTCPYMIYCVFPTYEMWACYNCAENPDMMVARSFPRDSGKFRVDCPPHGTTTCPEGCDAIRKDKHAYNRPLASKLKETDMPQTYRFEPDPVSGPRKRIRWTGYNISFNADDGEGEVRLVYARVFFYDLPKGKYRERYSGGSRVELKAKTSLNFGHEIEEPEVLNEVDHIAGEFEPVGEGVYELTYQGEPVTVITADQ